MVIVIFFVVAAAVFAVLGFAPFARRSGWLATVPPLASIIGSGFLVSAPLIARQTGSYAVFAMMALLAVAACFGAAIRHNIAHVEGRDDTSALVRGLDRLSELTLAAAYLISVAFYLSLLGSFVTRIAFGAPDRALMPWIATALVSLIAAMGWSGGLARVIRLESWIIALNLSIIAGIMATLVWYDVGVAQRAGMAGLVPLAGHIGLGNLPVLLGLLIVVQGFETSRYMGERFEAPIRIRTMRRAQMIAAGIYLVFFVLVMPLLPDTLDVAGDTAIIDVVAAVGAILPLVLTVGAAASQFSAAVADSIGGAELVVDLDPMKLTTEHAFPVLGGAVIAIIWSTDIFGVISLASKAFAFYYMLQCLVAAAEIHARRGITLRVAGFAALAVVAASVVVLGVPAG